MEFTCFEKWLDFNKSDFNNIKTFRDNICDRVIYLNTVEHQRLKQKKEGVIGQANNHILKAIKLITDYENSLLDADNLRLRTENIKEKLTFCSADILNIRSEALDFETRIEKSMQDGQLLLDNIYDRVIQKTLDNMDDDKEYDDEVITNQMNELYEEISIEEDVVRKSADLLLNSYIIQLSYGNSKKDNYQNAIAEMIEIFFEHCQKEPKINGEGVFFNLVDSCFKDINIFLNKDTLLRYIRDTKTPSYIFGTEDKS